MFGLMKGEGVAAESTGGLAVGDVLQSSVKTKSDVNAIATRGSHRVNVLVWSYHDDSDQSAPVEIRLKIEGLPQGLSQVLLEHLGGGPRSQQCPHRLADHGFASESLRGSV